MDGRIRCIDNVDDTRMVCTAELPLEVLVQPDQQDMFVFPGEYFVAVIPMVRNKPSEIQS